jgi:hypothetical protein
MGSRPVSGSGTTRAGDADQAANGHQVDLAVGKAHHLGLDLHRVVTVIVDHQAATAQGDAQAFGLQGQADHAQ